MKTSRKRIDANYRKIYEDFYKVKIPREENGRAYEIHHIDGNHLNNDPSNLIAVTLREHYDIHYSKGDFSACVLMGKKLSLTPAELSALATQHNNSRVLEGTHSWVGGDYQRELANERSLNGTHPWQTESYRKYRSEKLLRAVEDGTNPFTDSELQREWALQGMKNGTNPFSQSDYQSKQAKKRWTNQYDKNLDIYRRILNLVDNGKTNYEIRKMTGTNMRTSSLEKIRNGTHGVFEILNRK